MGDCGQFLTFFLRGKICHKLGFCVYTYAGGECVDTSCPPIVGMYDTGCKAILWSMALAIRVSCAVYGTGKEGQLRGLCQRQMWVVWAVYVV